MLKDTQQVTPPHKMKHSFYPSTSQPILTLLSLAMLSPIPRAVTSYPRFPAAILPVLDGPEWEMALLQLQVALDAPGETGRFIQPQDPRLAQLIQELEPREEEEGEGGWGQEVLLRSQRGELLALPLSPFPRGHSLLSMQYQDDGEEEEGGERRNEALTSIAGGLQAFSREKGGFGFRFGRKRRTKGGGGTEAGERPRRGVRWMREGFTEREGGLMGTAGGDTLGNILT